MLVSQSGTTLMAIYSTLEGCMQTDLLRRIFYADDMDKTPIQKQNCKWEWIKLHSDVSSMT